MVAFERSPGLNEIELMNEKSGLRRATDTFCQPPRQGPMVHRHQQVAVILQIRFNCAAKWPQLQRSGDEIELGASTCVSFISMAATTATPTTTTTRTATLTCSEADLDNQTGLR